MLETKVWLKDASGLHEVLATPPNLWQGETGLVGPFSSREVTTYFATTAVAFRQLNAVMERIFPYRDGWYVEIKSLAN